MVLIRCAFRFLLLFCSTKLFTDSCIVRQRTIIIHLPKSIQRPKVDDNVANETRSRRRGCCSSLSLQLPISNLFQQRQEIEDQLYSIAKVHNFDTKYKPKETGSDNVTSMDLLLHREKDLSWKVSPLQPNAMIELP